MENQFFEEIRNKERKLSRKEENLLIAQAQTGCTKSRDQVFYSNARFAIFEARKRQMRHLEDELIQVACVGLYKAIDLFDCSRKNKFITYAAWHIKCELNLWFTQNYRTIRLPSNICNQIHKGENEALDFTSCYSSDAMEPEVVENFNPQYDEIYNDLDLKRQNIYKLISFLDGRKQFIIAHRIGLDGQEPETFDAIGKRIGLSGAQIRNIWFRAIATLKSKYSKEQLIQIFF